jgi:hypothetical protein
MLWVAAGKDCHRILKPDRHKAQPFGFEGDFAFSHQGREDSQI